MTQGVHPFPSRTRKLSPVVPKILGWRRPGKIGRCQHKIVSISLFKNSYHYNYSSLDKVGCIFLWCVLLFTFIQLVIVVRRNMLGISRKTDNICRIFVTVFIWIYNILLSNGSEKPLFFWIWLVLAISATLRFFDIHSYSHCFRCFQFCLWSSLWSKTSSPTWLDRACRGGFLCVGL